MFKWFRVSLNGGKTAVRAESAEEALNLHAAYNGQLSVYPNTTVIEITDEEAETCYYKIR